MLLIALMFQATAAAAAAPPPTAHPPAPQQMIDALHAAFGEHKARAVHAKGILAEGEFIPAPEAATISQAVLFQGKAMPALVRFSNFTGLPDIADNIAQANPRGLAVKVTLPGGRSADIVTHSANGFPAATAEEFRQLLLAAGQSGPGVAQPTPVEKFLATHPDAQAFFAGLKPAPVSYGSLTYFGVNSFKFSDRQGAQRFVRYRFVPEGGEAFLTSEAAAGKAPDYLQQELPARLARGPIVFTWYAQVASGGDAIENPAIAWPESRKLVKLGTLRVLRVVKDQAGTDKTALFMPTNVPTGIEPADPMLLVRQGAYPISFAHRQ